MKKVFALNFILTLSLLFGGFLLSCSNQESEKDENNDSAVATWIQNSDNSNFYIFYADNTVELYQSNKLTLTRNELTYEGNPASESVVTIKNKAGISINKFVILSDGGILTAKDSADSSKVFTVQKTSSDNGGNQNNGNGGNNIVCTYYMKGEESTYYVFYADNTAEYYSADKLANSRSEIKYEGNPLATGSVKIKIALTNTPLITFTVKEADGTLIPYVELVPGFPTEFTLEKSGEDGNQNSGNDNNNGGSEKQGDESEPIATPPQSDTNTDVLCAWIADGDSSNYYIFYSDNSVDVYSSGKLENKGLTKYTGDPTKKGETVKINVVMSGVTQELLSYTVKSISGNIVTTSYNGFDVKFTMGTSSDSTSGNTTGNSGSTSGTTGTSSNVVCKWVFQDDATSYYIFYTDNSVDVYSYDKLENKGLTKYTGDPTKVGETVKINVVMSGVTQELLSYTIKSISGNIVVASYNGFEMKFTMGTSTDSTPSNSGNSSIENVENKTNANTTENSYDNVLVYDCDEINITDATGTIGTTELFDGGLSVVQTQSGKIKIVESSDENESHHYIQTSCGSRNLSKLASQSGYLKIKAAQPGSEKVVFTFKKTGSTITDNYIVLIDANDNELGRSEVISYSSTDDNSEVLTREITATVPEYFYVVFVRSAASGGFKFTKIEQLY